MPLIGIHFQKYFLLGQKLLLGKKNSKICSIERRKAKA